MAIDLPEVIDTYFKADKKGNAQAISECFTQDAVVTDEGNTYTVEPFAMEEEDGRTVITSHLVGNFPGSPVDLRYFFVLKDDRIAELKIVP